VRKVFSSYELSEMVLVRDALVHGGFEVSTSNEHSGFTAIPEFRPQADLWITDDADYQRARRIVAETLATLDSKTQHTPWNCVHCGEENPQSFETCWSCARDKKDRSDA
jgi:hypothetical protein